MISASRNPRWLLVLLLAAALGVRVGASFWFQTRVPQGSQFYFGDSETYWTLARQLAHGEPFQYGSPDAKVFRTPGFPVLLVPLFWIFGDDPPVLAGRIYCSVFGVIAVALTYFLANALGWRRCGLLAAALAAFMPGSIATSIFVLSEAPFAPAMLLHLLLAVKALKCEPSSTGISLALFSGIIAGLAVLIRPSWILFPCLWIVFWLVDKRFWHNLRLAIFMIAGMVIALIPWWIRNFNEVGKFVPTTLQVGASLYDGLNPDADGASEMSFVRRFENLERQRPQDTADPFEYRVDRHMFHKAVEWAQAHPHRTTELAIIKFRRMWGPISREIRLGPRWTSWILAVPYIAVIVLAGVGIVRGKLPLAVGSVIWLPAVYFTMLHVVFVSSVRYREPAMYLFYLASAAAILRPPKREPAAHPEDAKGP